RLMPKSSAFTIRRLLLDCILTRPPILHLAAPLSATLQAGIRCSTDQEGHLSLSTQSSAELPWCLLSDRDIGSATGEYSWKDPCPQSSGAVAVLVPSSTPGYTASTRS